MLVGLNAELLAGTIGGGEMESRALKAASSAITSGKASTLSVDLIDPASGDAGVCGGTVELFIEPLLSAPTLLIIGAGHVGKALVHLAKWCGLRVLLMDDRVELCTPEAAPGADVYLPGPLREKLGEVQLNPTTCVALMTRGFPMDVSVLPLLLASPAKYVGVIGSKRRWATAQAALLAQGMSQADLARVHAPIGLEIGAETPEEIAVSVMAEIIAALAPQRMKL